MLSYKGTVDTNDRTRSASIGLLPPSSETRRKGAGSVDQTLSSVIKLLLCQCTGKHVKGNNPYCAKLEMILTRLRPLLWPQPVPTSLSAQNLRSLRTEFGDRSFVRSCRSKRRNCSVQATRWLFIHHFLFLVVCSMQRRVASVQSRISFVLSLLYDRNSLILEKMILCSKLYDWGCC